MSDNELIFNGLDVTMSRNNYNLLCRYKEDYVKDMNVKDKKTEDLQQRIDKAIEIIVECKKLMPHEFDWDEQIDYIEEILKGDSNE